MNKRTIIMLSAKRSGSSAVFKIFQKHPDVGVCHIDQNIHYWESNFWNMAAEAINGKPERFIKRFIEVEKSHPFLNLPAKFTEKSVFNLWDQILEKLGPIVFDKSPQYLSNYDAMNLLKKYIDLGNDVRLFGMIRDPKDTITSQYELWSSKVEGDSPKKREESWLENYKHLEQLQEDIGYFPVYKYEEFCNSPAIYARQLLMYSGLSDKPYTYDHIRPVNVGRYKRTLNKDIRNWKFSDEFVEINKKYGYDNEIVSDKVKLKDYIKFFAKKVKHKISPYKVN